MQVLFLFLPFAVIFKYVSAVVLTYDVPLDMARCYGSFRKRTTLAKTPAVAIQTHCENMYMWKHAKELNVLRGAQPNTISYITNLFQSTRQEIMTYRTRRVKRQTNPLAGQGGRPGGPGGPKPPKNLRIRKEIRMMSEKERQAFFGAVNKAKQNKTIEPNKYDALAEFHTGMTSVSAHGGCNFHGWHRMYLLMFENALREEGPEFADVTVPYWDTVLEARMDDSVNTALFSHYLMGSGQGAAKGGIMKDGWDSSTGPITRNIGTDGPLPTEEMIANVTRHTRMSAICGEDSDIDDDWEFIHNGVHRWCDGQMAILSSAVYDPIFWITHAFTDLVWELFRDNQKRAGEDPESDYPVNPTTMGAHELHIPDAEMGFADLKVIDGLSEMFTTEWYKYAPRPNCDKKKNCESKYLKCMPSKDATKRAQNHQECVARTVEEVEEWEEEQKKPKPCIIPVSTNNTHKHRPPKEIKPVQNTFCMNGQSDTGQWVYVPVKLILRRPPDYKSYGSYPVERGKITKVRGDIYSPSAYSNVARHLRNTEVPAIYKDCIEPETPTNTIYVKSVGLNYEGVYKEYAILDRRLAMNVATAYVAVRKPMSDTDVSVAILNAQDSCGRICKPICKVPGSQIFRPCSGAVKITGGRPLQFGNSFGDAVLDVWDFDTDKNCPQLTTGNIIVSFYCDYSTEWVWPSVDPLPRKPPAVTPLPPPEKTTVTTGCSLGWGCVVSKPCAALTTCTNGEVLECLKSCHMYASCFNNKYMLYQCRRGERYLKGKGCVDSRRNPCNYKTSGLNRWRKQQRGKRRRSAARRSNAAGLA